MARMPQLEAFPLAPSAALNGRYLDAGALESERLEAYEAGFAAGWEEAGNRADAAASERAGQISASLAGLDFGWSEARQQCLASIAPVFEAMLGQLLPSLAAQSLLPATVAALEGLAREALEAPLQLLVPQGREGDFREVLGAEGLAARGLELEIVESADLLDFEARILSGQRERRVDLSGLIARINAALAEFYSPQPAEISSRKDARHG